MKHEELINMKKSPAKRKRNTAAEEYEDFIRQANEGHDRLIPVICSIAMMHAELEECLAHHVAIAINRDQPALGLVVVERMSLSQKLELYKKLVHKICAADEAVAKHFAEMKSVVDKANTQRNRTVHGDWHFHHIDDCYSRCTESERQDSITLLELEQIIDLHQQAIDSIYNFAIRFPMLKSPGPILDNILGKNLC